MKLKKLQAEWERFGSVNPMSVVIADPTQPGRVWNAGEFFALGRQDVDRWLTRLAELGRSASGERALDFGCGAGRLSQALARYYQQVVGVDVSRPMLATASDHNAFPDRVSFVHNTRENLRVFDDGHFDLVLTHIVLQHLPAKLIEAYLGEFLRVLRPGGALVFQIPIARIGRRGRYAVIERLPWLVRGYRRLRYGPSPQMEMHAVAEERIAQVVADGGGVILAADPDQSAGSEFESRIFYVMKAG